MTIPTGVNYVRLMASVYVSAGSTHNQQAFNKNGNTAFVGGSWTFSPNSAMPTPLMSAIIPVVAGDYFDLSYYHNAGSTLIFSALHYCYFQLEVIQF